MNNPLKFGSDPDKGANPRFKGLLDLGRYTVCALLCAIPLTFRFQMRGYDNKDVLTLMKRG